MWSVRFPLSRYRSRRQQTCRLHWRHAEGSGRKDILTLGETDSASPYLQVEIYRAGSEIHRFDDPQAEIIASARALEPTKIKRLDGSLASKFGPLTLVPFTTSKGHNAIASALCAPMTIRVCNCPAGSARAARNSSSKAPWRARLTD